MNKPKRTGSWTVLWVALAAMAAVPLVVPVLAAPPKDPDVRAAAKAAKAEKTDAASKKAADEKAKADKLAEEAFRAKMAAATTQSAAGQPASDEDYVDETQKMLAARDKRKGALFPGKDPAFIILPRPAVRSEVPRELLTPRVREMTDKALNYLISKQSPSDGGWSDTQFKDNTGVTALCCLALMGEGTRPRVGKYGKQLDRGLEFLLNNVQTSGAIAGKGSNPLGPGYEHALSTLALLYAYGDLPHHPEVRDVISKAIQLLARSQKLDGGWRYDFSREGQSDMSVTANVLWVLRTAKKAGFTVSAESVAKGVAFVEKCAMPDGQFRYRTFGIVAEPSLGGTGVIALSNNGSLNHPLIPKARNRIAYDYERYSIEDLKGRRYFVFGCFYASLAMYACGDYFNYQYGDEPKKLGGFVPWFKKSTAVLSVMQRKDGEFWDEYDNTVYATAMTAIVLQAPLGYLPIYER